MSYYRSASAGSSRRRDAHIDSWLTYTSGNHPLDRPLAAGASPRQARLSSRSRPWLEDVISNPCPHLADNDGRSGGRARRRLCSKTLSAPLPPGHMRYLRSNCAVDRTSADSVEEICPICLESLRLFASERCVRLPCGGGHEFHMRCVEPWFRKCSLCPKCRQPLHIASICGKADASPRRANSFAPEWPRADRGSTDRRHEKHCIAFSLQCGRTPNRPSLHTNGISANALRAAHS